MIEHLDSHLRDTGGLEPGVVHLWTARLPLGDRELAACESLLSAEERQRAGQRRLMRDRARFVSVRGVLRRILATYCGQRAEVLRIAYAPNGKPFLGDPGIGIEFNVAHAGSVALLAFVREAGLGVDVERIRTVRRADRIAERIMPATRLAIWRSLPPAERTSEFIREWTRLEAFAKLTGDGVWKTLIDRRELSYEPATWFDLAPRRGYLGTLAVRAGPMRLVSHVWPGAEDGTSRTPGGVP